MATSRDTRVSTAKSSGPNRNVQTKLSQPTRRAQGSTKSRSARSDQTPSPQSAKRAQWAIIPNINCELCDLNDIQWKCTTCDEFMCDLCKKTHLKSKASSNHKVTSLKDTEKHNYNGDGKNTTSKCKLHPNEDIQLYCIECGSPVCRDCAVSQSHHKHTFSKIEDVIEEHQREISKMITESSQKISDSTSKMSSVQKYQGEYSKDMVKRIEDVKKRNVQLKNIVDKITENLIDQLKETEKKDQEKLQKIEKQIETDLTNLKEFKKQCEEKQRDRSVEMIDFVKDTYKHLQEIIPCSLTDPPNPPTFVPKNVDEDEIENLFGYLDLDEAKASDFDMTNHNPGNNFTFHEKVISKFRMDYKDLVEAVDEMCWIGKFEGKGVTLVTDKGKTVTDVKTNFYLHDMAASSSGELLVTVTDSHKVKKLVTNGKFVDFYVAPRDNETTGITVTDDNYVIVCIVICDVIQTHFHKHDKGGKLVKLSLSGKLIKTIEFEKDSKKPLFSDPHTVSSNQNGDLIVVQSKDVVVIDKSGRKRFTYGGRCQGLEFELSPIYVTTDPHENILINDDFNNLVHLLDKDGHLLQYLLTDIQDLERPWALTTDVHGRLWVCSTNDKVFVIKYLT